VIQGISGEAEETKEYKISKKKEVIIMPRRDGTGPSGQGSGIGRGQGLNRGRMGGPFAAGPGGDCICPKCKTKVEHVVGQSCNALSCPKCGSKMTRS
jgi:hypothetical protein